MIIEELDTNIIIDEIRHNATTSQLYFMSCLLGYEMLTLSEDWPARIYTSEFICDVLLKKKPRVHPKYFRVLKVNVPTKFQSKDKSIFVTMFEPEGIKNSVMFHFDDGTNKYLYTGVFNEVSSYCRNEDFMICIQKGIDYVYIDTVLCNSNPYICTEDTIDEIKTISLKHPDSKLAVIIPNFGYEKLLLELVQAFPQNVYLTKTQKCILTKLGQSDYLSSDYQSCRIIIFIPGIATECLKTELITIYITVGDVPSLNNDYGCYMRQWSPLPSLMDQQVLLEMIRPNYIVPIKENDFQDSVELPFSLMSFAKKKPNVNTDSDTELSDSNSFGSIGSISSAAVRIQNYSPTVSMASTKVFVRQAKKSTETPNSKKSKQLEKEKEVPSCCTENTKLRVCLKRTDLIKNRTRVIRQRTDFVFSDSSEDAVNVIEHKGNTETQNSKKSKQLEKANEVPSHGAVNTKLPITLKATDLTKKRTRIIPQRTDLVFSESSEDLFT